MTAAASALRGGVCLPSPSAPEVSNTMSNMPPFATTRGWSGCFSNAALPPSSPVRFCHSRSLAANRMASEPSRSTRRPGTRLSSSRSRRRSLALHVVAAHGHGVAQGHDLAAVDARDRRIAVHERGQHRERVPLVREVHRDARAHVGGLARQPRRRDDDVELRLELRQDARHEVGRSDCAKSTLERQPLEELARRRHLAEGPQRVRGAHDAARHHFDHLGRALEAKPEAVGPRGRVLDGRARHDGRAGNAHGRAVERDLGAARERLEEVGDARREHRLARRRAEHAVDAHVVVGRRQGRELRAAGAIAGERLLELLLAPVGVHEEARHREQPVAPAEAVDEARRLGGRGRAGERLALLGGLRHRDRGGHDVHARVDLALAVARPLGGVGVERDRRGDGEPGRADAQRDLAGAGAGERDGVLPRELHALRPDARQARLPNRVEELLHSLWRKLQSAAGGVEAKPPHHPDRFDEHGAAHLGVTLRAIHEHDGDLLDLHAAA